VALVRTDVSEIGAASIIRAEGISELATLAVTTSLIIFTLMMGAIRSFEISVLTGVTWHLIPEDGILHSYRREHLRYNINRLDSVVVR
jgi:hypothetical protein